MRKALLTSCLLVAGAILAQAGHAQSPSVTSTLAAMRVETVAGKVVLTPADSVKPGDLVEYTSSWRNAGKNGVDKFVATLPVPAGTTFVAGSTHPAAAQASTDGTRFAAIPLVRTVRLPDGTSRQEPVPLSEYRYVRWELGTLAAGTDAVVKLRVRIDAEATAAAKP